MCVINFLLKKVLPLPKILKQNRFLFIGPHPDDIEIAAGATVSRLCQLNKSVKFLICTDGRYGIEDLSITPQQTVEIRKKEAIIASSTLGVTDIEFLPFSDGGYYDNKELTAEILRVISDYQPDIIFAPDPKLLTELHIDHINVGESSGYAFLASNVGKQMVDNNLKKAEVKGIAYYFTNKPNSFVKISKQNSKSQIDAIKAHSSQFPAHSYQLKGILAYIKIRQFRYGIKKFKGRADSFRVQGAIHSHCAPESENF